MRRDNPFEDNPDAGKDWGQKEKGEAEDEMVGWHQWANEQTLGDREGQGDLECCSPWGHKESDTTEWLNKNGWFCKGREAGPAFDNIIMNLVLVICYLCSSFLTPLHPDPLSAFLFCTQDPRKLTSIMWSPSLADSWPGLDNGRLQQRWEELYPSTTKLWVSGPTPALSGFWQHHFFLFAPSGQRVTTVFHWLDWMVHHPLLVPLTIPPKIRCCILFS